MDYLLWNQTECSTFSVSSLEVKLQAHFTIWSKVGVVNERLTGRARRRIQQKSLNLKFVEKCVRLDLSH